MACGSFEGVHLITVPFYDPGISHLKCSKDLLKATKEIIRKSLNDWIRYHKEIYPCKDPSYPKMRLCFWGPKITFSKYVLRELKNITDVRTEIEDRPWSDTNVDRSNMTHALIAARNAAGRLLRAVIDYLPDMLEDTEKDFIGKFEANGVSPEYLANDESFGWTVIITKDNRTLRKTIPNDKLGD